MRRFLLAATALLAIPLSVTGQQTRAQLVEQARSEFDVASRISLLFRSADPGLAPTDSVWADGVHELAQSLLAEGQETVAGVWLRWAAWLGEGWRIDTLSMLPEVVLANQRAVSAVAIRVPPSDPLVNAEWRWSDTPAQVGSIELAPDQPQNLSVTVDGGALSPGVPVELAPGSYRLTATADGFETADVTRDVLPGVATVLRFDLTPSLGGAIRSRLESGTVRIRSLRDGDQTLCGTGYVATNDGYVVTNFESIRDADRVDVEVGGSTHTGVPVVATDVGRGIAVLRLEGGEPAALDVRSTGDVSERVGWTLHFPTCSAPARAISTYMSDIQAGSAGFPLSRQLSAAAPGSALIDESGGLLGVVVSGNRAAPRAWADELVAEGRTFVVEAPAGGPPWLWIGGGAAAIGLGVALLGGGTTPPPPPDTGSITIVFDRILALFGIGGGL